MLKVIKAVYPNGDYGKNYINVIYDYGYLGACYAFVKNLTYHLSILMKAQNMLLNTMDYLKSQYIHHYYYEDMYLTRPTLIMALSQVKSACENVCIIY